MDATTKFASNVTLINITEQETFNATSSNVSGWEYPPVGFYRDISAPIWRGIPPILISIGTIGNAVTIFVLLRQKKMTSKAVFLFALALSDTLIQSPRRVVVPCSHIQLCIRLSTPFCLPNS
ncbi:hypothetical protein DPMN_142834 [Dreissena polymorpha]|uniref:G-protein coupled receptors family 1 profile domain-containing protein n=1 Tax=Dreissena polymorpha TaxID=45954 RepID=A0A9D4JMK0_DREPO|nr:hypothetical protein DPMN_142834 [Dreissena polymorpha]